MKYKLTTLALLYTFWLPARSCLRPRDPFVPIITAQWKDKKKIYYLQDSLLEANSIFYTFDKTYFYNHLLPMDDLPMRSTTQPTVSGKKIYELLEKLYQEIKDKKSFYSDFIVLKKNDFNLKKQAGLIILKAKKYPFVVKFFLETPRSFIRPYNKGFIASCHFIVGGGTNRHLIGFTRLANRETVSKLLQASPEWKDKVDLPQKWFWIPAEEKWITLTGYNIGGYSKIHFDIPAIYAIVAQEIEGARTFSMKTSKDSNTAIRLCNYLNFRIDAHLNNFMIEKESNKIIIIDTEHFPSLVGLKERPRIHSYIGFYWHLVKKGVKEGLFRTKKERRDLQRNPEPLFSHP